MSISRTWGTTREERALRYGCDDIEPEPDLVLFRGVTVDATPAKLFRWLCQLRAAPYSYDWIDNWGRRSPRRLTPGLERLEVGQTVMTIFDLASFEADRELTVQTRRGSLVERLFGPFAVSYRVVPSDENACRLLVKIAGRRPTALLSRAVFNLLPWGDLVMMRRQLLNLKRLAERSA